MELYDLTQDRQLRSKVHLLFPPYTPVTFEPFYNLSHLFFQSLVVLLPLDSCTPNTKVCLP
jgi:hypothetical protein